MYTKRTALSFLVCCIWSGAISNVAMAQKQSPSLGGGGNEGISNQEELIKKYKNRRVLLDPRDFAPTTQKPGPEKPSPEECRKVARDCDICVEQLLVGAHTCVAGLFWVGPLISVGGCAVGFFAATWRFCSRNSDCELAEKCREAGIIRAEPPRASIRASA